MFYNCLAPVLGNILEKFKSHGLSLNDLVHKHVKITPYDQVCW